MLNGDDNTVALYLQRIKNIKLFKSHYRLIAFGCTIRLASGVISLNREELSRGYFHSCIETCGPKYILFATTAGPESISELLKQT